jgi:hypothetical protein
VRSLGEGLWRTLGAPLPCNELDEFVQLDSEDDCETHLQQKEVRIAGQFHVALLSFKIEEPKSFQHGAIRESIGFYLVSRDFIGLAFCDLPVKGCAKTITNVNCFERF